MIRHTLSATVFAGLALASALIGITSVASEAELVELASAHPFKLAALLISIPTIAGVLFAILSPRINTNRAQKDSDEAIAERMVRHQS